MVKGVQAATLLGTLAGGLSVWGAAQAQDAGVTAVPQLPSVRIEAESADAAGTGQTLYQPVTTSATKLATPVLATPQAVTTVTRRQLDEQAAQTVSEALRYTAGVLADRDVNTRYNSVFLRGFGAFGTATTYVSFLDGLKLPRGQAFAQAAIDPYLLDRLDVLKGPSAVLYGQISPGGLVNQVSRQPDGTPAGELMLEGGSHGRAQAGLHARGALDDANTLRYSVTAIGRNADTRYDEVSERRYAIAPSLRWQPNADTSLTLSAYWQQDPRGGYFNSLYPTFLAPAAYQDALSRTLNVGDPTVDHFDRTQRGVGYALEHRASPMLTLRSQLRYLDIDLDFRSLQMAAPLTANGLIPRHALQSIETVRGVSMDNQAQIELNTGAIAHRVLLGLDYQHSSSDWLYRYGAAAPLDVTRPVYGQPFGPLAPMIDNGQTQRQTGLYLQDQASLGDWHAVLGVRRDWTKQVTDNHLAGTSTHQTSAATSYRAALLREFAHGVSVYGSYATSFEPTLGVDASGAPFVPSRAQQYEVGVKFQPASTDTLITLAAFDIRQRNALVPDSLGFNRQEGRIRSRGLELEARGQLTPSLSVIAAVTWLDTRVTQAAVAANQGKRPQAVPDIAGSLWLDYRLPHDVLPGLSVGGGVRMVGSSYADNANTIKASGYTVVDAALRYDLGAVLPHLQGLEARLNVSNLFNKTYYASCSSDFFCQYGNERQILAGLRYRW